MRTSSKLSLVVMALILAPVFVSAVAPPLDEREEIATGASVLKDKDDVVSTIGPVLGRDASNDNRMAAQSFVASSSYYPHSVVLFLTLGGEPTAGGYYVTIEGDSAGVPTGAPLITSGGKEAVSLLPSGEVTFNFSCCKYKLTEGTKYWIVLHGNTDGYSWDILSTDTTHATKSGAVYIDLSDIKAGWKKNDYDFFFKVFAHEVIIKPSAATITKIADKMKELGGLLQDWIENKGGNPEDVIAYLKLIPDYVKNSEFDKIIDALDAAIDLVKTTPTKPVNVADFGKRMESKMKEVSENLLKFLRRGGDPELDIKPRLEKFYANVQKRQWSDAESTMDELVSAVKGKPGEVPLGEQAKANRDMWRIRDFNQLIVRLDDYYRLHSEYPIDLSELPASNDESGVPYFITDPLQGDEPEYYAYAAYTLTAAWEKPSSSLRCKSAGSGCLVYHLGVSLETKSDILPTDGDIEGDVVHGADTLGCKSEKGRYCLDKRGYAVPQAEASPPISYP